MDLTLACGVPSNGDCRPPQGSTPPCAVAFLLWVGCGAGWWPYQQAEEVARIKGALEFFVNSSRNAESFLMGGTKIRMSRAHANPRVVCRWPPAIFGHMFACRWPPVVSGYSHNQWNMLTPTCLSLACEVQANDELVEPPIWLRGVSA